MTQFENGQKIGIDMSAKKTYRWQITIKRRVINPGKNEIHKAAKTKTFVNLD